MSEMTDLARLCRHTGFCASRPHVKDPHAPELRFLQRHFGPLDGALILDVGAGTGAFLESCLDAGVHPHSEAVDVKPRGSLVRPMMFPVEAPDRPYYDLVTFRESLYYLDLDATREWLFDHAGWVYIKSVNPLANFEWMFRTQSPHPAEQFTVPAMLHWLDGTGFGYVAETYPREPGWWRAPLWPLRAWRGTTDRYGLLAQWRVR